MVEESNRNRLWSDGQSVYRVATVGVRLFAGFLDWVFTIGIAVIAGFILATAYNGIIAGDEPIASWTVVAIVGTVVHLAPAIMVVRRGEKPGYTALRLVIKRDDAGRIGWKRALARGLLGSPGLTVPWLVIGTQNLIVLLVELSSTWFGTSNSVAENLGGYGIGFWSATLAATWIGVLVLVVLNHVWMIVDAKGRGLHDVIVGTVVVGGRIVRRDPDAMTTLAADRTRGDLDYPTAHRVF